MDTQTKTRESVFHLFSGRAERFCEDRAVPEPLETLDLCHVARLLTSKQILFVSKKCFVYNRHFHLLKKIMCVFPSWV